jgi:ankyrin repeat protein
LKIIIWFVKACEGNHLNIVKFLLEKGAKIEGRSKKVPTPLFIAAKLGHLDIVKFLIDRGARIESKIKTGATPLYICKLKNLLVLKCFLVQIDRLWVNLAANLRIPYS